MNQSVLRSIVPPWLRRSPFAAAFRDYLSRRGLAHDWIYNSQYYADTVEAPAVQSATDIADSILVDVAPRTVVDVGCGTGALLDVFRKSGCEVFGFEYSEAGLDYCRKRALPVAKFDLEKDQLVDDRTFDVAVSMEVAEHLPLSVADRYVQLLARLAPVVVFTAAPPGQGGHDHVNEQPASYWVAKFANKGFAFDEELSRRWSERWRTGGRVRDWYYRNLMVFRAGNR
jgi:SAM-dependent methyltransferase